jgi:hypothetical protein
MGSIGRSPIKFCETFFGISFLDSQKYAFQMSWTTPFNVWCQSRNSGKALDLNTPIPTPNGWSTMGDLKVGDYVLDEKGSPTKITYVSDIFYNHKCYEVKFEDGFGEVIEINKYYDWFCEKRHEKLSQILK